jgi:hypothetical protein
MTSSLLISALDIPFSSLWISPAAVADEDLNEYNLISKNRYSLFQFNAAAVANSVRFDLGTAVTKAVDHVIIARADILKNAGVTTITLAGGSDGITFGTTARSDAAFASATLLGPRSNDYVAEINTTSPLRWWRMSYAGSSSKFCHSALSFGQWFDFGCEAGTQPLIDRVPAKESRFYADSGAQYQYRITEEIYRFTFTWSRVTNAKVLSFMNNIMRYAHRIPVFLYTTTAGARHELLDNQRLIHARIVPDSFVRHQTKADRNEITLTFEEIIG